MKHMSPATQTPPVGCPLLIRLPTGRLVQVEPVGYVRPHHLKMLRSGRICGTTLEDKPDERNGVTVPLYAAPQPAEREIPGSYPVSGQIFFRGASNEWILELTGSVNGTAFTARHTQPADTRPEDVAGLPALYETAPDVSALADALGELIDLMEDTRQGEYIPDSFTTQPARIALEAYHNGSEK